MYKFINSNLKLVKMVSKWYFCYYVLRKPLPLIANLIITSKCNFDCKFCYLGPPENLTTISLTAYKGIIDDLCALGTYFVYISGGEPLIVEDIIDRLAYAKRRIPHIHLISNGYLIDKKMALKLASTGIDTIAISIDALEAKHDKYRGQNGAFAQAIQALVNLKENAPKIKLFVKTQVAPWNIDDLPKLTKVLNVMEVRQMFDPTVYSPVLNNKIPKEELVIADDMQIKKIEEFIESICGLTNAPIKIQSLRQLKNYYLNLRDNRSNKSNLELYKDKCSIPFFHIQVGPDGLITPCGALLDQIREFSIYDNSLRGIIADTKYLNAIKELKACKKCLEVFQNCYLTPRMYFPIGNFIKYSFFKRHKVSPKA